MLLTRHLEGQALCHRAPRPQQSSRLGFIRTYVIGKENGNSGKMKSFSEVMQPAGGGTGL